MWSVFAVVRFMTPVKRPAGVLYQPGRRSQVLSVTVQPLSEATMSYCQRAMGTPVCDTMKANRCSGAASVTVHLVVHRRQPLRLVPLNTAPRVAADDPLLHCMVTVSSANSDITARSVISA